MPKRLGLGRTQKIIEELKRELQMGGTILTNITQQGTSTSTSAAGAVSGSTTAPTTRVADINGEIVTTITVDLTNLSASAGLAGQVIGNKEAGIDNASKAWLLQWDTATNGVCYKAEMTCLAALQGNGLPGSNAAVQLGCDSLSLEQGEVGARTTLVAQASPWSAGTTLQNLTVGTSGELAQDEFVYLAQGATVGGAANAQFSAGKFVIRLYGHKDF